MRPVQQSSELRRILELPRRPADGGPTIAELTTLLSDALRTSTGTMQLFPIQAFALAELVDQGGLFGPIDVGEGKALVTLLAPVVARAYRPVLFLPAKLRVQTERNVVPKMAQHWRLHRNLKILSYEMLSSPKSSLLLDELDPDMVILDEAHALRHASSARTKRFLRFMKAHQKTKLVALSGTMTKKSLFDFWEMLKLALPGFKCPLPLHYSILRDWDSAIGAGASWAHNEPMDPGALMALCKTLPNGERETIHQGFHRRLVETPGVVCSTIDRPIGSSLILTAKYPAVPDVISVALRDLRKNMITAWGEVVEDGIALARHARQLSAGFYYRWKWPDDKPDTEWLYARADWHRELRHHLKRNIPGCDSPFLVAAAIVRGDIESETYDGWCAVRDRYKPHPPVESVWLSDFLIHEIVKWLKESTLGTSGSPYSGGIAWYEHTAVAVRLHQFGVKVFGAGPKAARALLEHRGGPIAASVTCHGTGTNLQDRWANNLVTSSPSSADVWHQLLARTHRRGQEADEVTCDVFQHTTELQDAFGAAVTGAPYMHIMGGKQKLLISSRVDFVS